MTSVSVTFFSLLLASCAVASNVSGRIELQDSRDPAVRKRSDFSGVVIWLEPADKTARPAGAAAKHVRMVQHEKTFTPHVLGIPVNSTVDFPNLDPIFHNAFSTFSGQVFDVGLYPPGKSRSVRFTRPGVVRVFCNIHASMSAVIVIADSPEIVTTEKNGQFEFANVPSGDYELHLFHERATAATLAQASTPVSVVDRDIVLPAITISESGYIQEPHNNKYGKPYLPAPDEGGTYPGSNK